MIIQIYGIIQIFFVEIELIYLSNITKIINGSVQVKIYFAKQRIMQLKQKHHLTLVIFFLIFMKFKKKELDTYWEL